jgi:alcohol dehydrogenase
VYSENLIIPLNAFHAGLGDNKIITSLCPGKKERMRRLMNVIESERIDLKALITHHYSLDQIEDAYALFTN